MAVISKGIKLSYKTGSAGEFVDLTDLQEIPELGGDKEAIEITTLEDAAHMYTDGILNYGDSLSFKFLYDKIDIEVDNNTYLDLLVKDSFTNYNLSDIKKLSSMAMVIRMNG